MNDIMEALFARDPEQTAKMYGDFKKNFEENMKDLGERRAIQINLQRYYEKELKVEVKYSKVIKDRLDKVKNLQTFSVKQLDLLKDTIAEDVKNLRLKETLGNELEKSVSVERKINDELQREKGRGSRFGRGRGGPSYADKHQFEPEIKYKGEPADLAKQFAAQGLTGEDLFDEMKGISKLARLSKKDFRDMYENINAMALKFVDINERTETAKTSFMKFADDKVFSKLDGLIDSSASKMLGLQKPLQDMKDKVIGQLGTKFEGMFTKALLPGLEGATAGATTFGITMGAALLPILAIVAAVAAIGFVLYKAWDEWKKFKENTIEVQKEFGLVSERAIKLTETTKELYLTNGNIALEWEESAETVGALYDQFLNVNSVTKELAQQSINYQKAYGFSAKEAAEILKTNKIIFGLSDEAMQMQDDHIVKYSAEIGFSAKEMKKMYGDASLVSKIGYENIDKMAKMAANAKMSFEDISEISEIFTLGEFEDSIETANKLLRMGIQVDPLALQFKLNEGDIAGVTQDIMKAFGNKDLSKMRGMDRKLIADAIGGEQTYLKVMEAQSAERMNKLSTDQKIANLQTASFDDLLKQTTQLDQIGGMWATIKRIFESIVARFAPAIDAFMKGFQEGIRPLVEGFAKANQAGEGLFGPAAIKRIVSFGVGVAKVVAGLVHFGEFLVDIFSGVFSTISMTWNILKGLFYFLKTEFLAVLWPFAKVIDFVAGTNISAGLEKAMSESIGESGSAFKEAGGSFVEGIVGQAKAYSGLAENAGLVAGKEDKRITSKDSVAQQHLAELKKQNEYLDALNKKSNTTEIAVDGKKIATATSKSQKAPV